MAEPTPLRGTTWGHPRGHAPLFALANDPGLGTPVEWEVRSLRDFGDVPVSELAGRYDLLVIDHPGIGEAVAQGLLHPLDELLDHGFLAGLAEASVGASWDSYLVDGRPYALPIDAAGHVSATRTDLLPAPKRPRTWREVLELAAASARPGLPRVALPLVPTDAWCVFLTLLASSGAPTFDPAGAMSGASAAIDVLELLTALARRVHPGSFQWDPVGVLESMASGDEVSFAPALFGYVNYAQSTAHRHAVRYGPVPALGEHHPPRPLLGGAGIAVSTSSASPRRAAAAAAHLCSEEVQRGAYFDHGGQPAHRSAWTDERCNATAGGFFADTLPGLDNAFLRPRLVGFTGYQTRAGHLILEVLTGRSSASSVAAELNTSWRRLRKAAA